jgi:hypothetical protein
MRWAGSPGRRGATAAQLAIAWVLSRGPDVIPLIGARRRDRLEEALGALDLSPFADDLAREFHRRRWLARATIPARWSCSTVNHAGLHDDNDDRSTAMDG